MSVAHKTPKFAETSHFQSRIKNIKDHSFSNVSSVWESSLHMDSNQGTIRFQQVHILIGAIETQCNSSCSSRRDGLKESIRALRQFKKNEELESTRENDDIEMHKTSGRSNSSNNNKRFY